MMLGRTTCFPIWHLLSELHFPLRWKGCKWNQYIIRNHQANQLHRMTQGDYQVQECLINTHALVEFIHKHTVTSVTEHSCSFHNHICIKYKLYLHVLCCHIEHRASIHSHWPLHHILYLPWPNIRFYTFSVHTLTHTRTYRYNMAHQPRPPPRYPGGNSLKSMQLINSPSGNVNTRRGNLMSFSSLMATCLPSPTSYSVPGVLLIHL